MELAKPSAPKMLGTFHKRDSHITEDCKALQPKPAQATRAAARAAQTVASAPELPNGPSMADLMELWKARNGSIGYTAIIPVPSSEPSTAYVGPAHSNLTRQLVTVDEKLRGPLSNMPLSFLPKDFLDVPATRPPPGSLTAPPDMELVLEATHAPMQLVTEAIQTIVPPEPATIEVVLSDADTPTPHHDVEDRDLPAGFNELPQDAPTRQGMVYGPCVPRVIEDSTNGGDAPTKRGKPLLVQATRCQDLYDPKNPNIDALLSHLSGSYHSDQSAGFHRSPRIDNSGPKPAMLINGRVVKNLLLGCGAEAVITGRSGATAMGITPDMICKGANVIRTATGALTERLDQTKEPVSFTLNPGTPDEVTIMAHVVIANQNAPDTLIGMSILGPAQMTTSFRKQRVKYYIEKGNTVRKCSLRTQLPILYGTPMRHALGSHVLKVYGSAVILIIPVSLSAQSIVDARKN